jgi:cell division protein FtsB
MLPQESKPAARRNAGVEPLRRKCVVAAPPSTLQRRIINLALVFVTVVLVVDALIGEKGLMESMRARREYHQLELSLDSLRRENARMEDEVKRLQDDPSTIEAVAREELGLIRDGEVLVIVKDEKPAH